MSEKEQSVVKNNNKPALRTGFTPEEQAKGRLAMTAAKKARQEAFLAALSRKFSITGACDEIEIGVSTVYAWLDKDTNGKFRERMDQAKNGALDRIEARFAHLGQEATQPHHVTAGLALLNANRENYNRARVEHSGPGGGPIVHAHAIAVKGMSDEELQAFLVKHLPKALPQAREISEENEG